MCSRAPTSAVAISHSMKSAPIAGGIVVLELDREDRLPGLAEIVERDVLILPARPGAEVDEEPVVAIGGRRAKRLARDGEHARALLAGRLRDQLLEPQPDARERRRRHEA